MGPIELLLVSYYAIRLGLTITKHGEERPVYHQRYNALEEVVTTIILFIVLWIGGFFK